MKKRKIAETDFLESSLPQTRRSQFFDILKINFKLLLKIGFVLIAFLSILLIKSMLVDHVNNAINLALKDGALTAEDATQMTNTTFIISEAVNIIGYPLLFIGLGGTLRVIRQLCFSEGVIFSYLFKKGLKDNLKQFLVMGVITALIQLGINAYTTIYGIDFISIAMLGLYFLIYLPIIVIYLYYSSIYTSNIAISLRNAGYFYIKSVLPTLGLVVVIFGPIILMEYFFNFVVVKQLIYVLLAIVVLPILLLIGYLINLNTFDKTINLSEFKELYRKGLYVPEEDKLL